VEAADGPVEGIFRRWSYEHRRSTSNESDVELADQSDQELVEPSFGDSEPPSDVQKQLLAVMRETKELLSPLNWSNPW